MRGKKQSYEPPAPSVTAIMPPQLRCFLCTRSHCFLKRFKYARVAASSSDMSFRDFSTAAGGNGHGAPSASPAGLEPPAPAAGELATGVELPQPVPVPVPVPVPLPAPERLALAAFQATYMSLTSSNGMICRQSGHGVFGVCFAAYCCHLSCASASAASCCLTAAAASVTLVVAPLIFAVNAVASASA